MARETGVVGSVASALDVLIFLAQKGGEVGITEIAEHFHLGKSTVHRLLSTLRSRDFVEQDVETSRYRVGLRAFEVGNAYLSHLGLSGVAAPFMEELVRQCDEKTNLAVLDKTYGEVVYIKMVDSQKAIRVYSQLGHRAPLNCTALGKAFLMTMSWEDALELISKKGMQSMTKDSITALDTLRRDLELARERGYSVDDEENLSEVRCLGAPVFDHSGQVAAALSISGPKVHIDDNRMHELGRLVKDAAAAISQTLGYREKALVS